jgi:excisionase family DNA binding protein
VLRVTDAAKHACVGENFGSTCPADGLVPPAHVGLADESGHTQSAAADHAGSLGGRPPDQLGEVLTLLRMLAQSTPTPSKYLTVREAAAYCRVAVQTIYNNRRYIARMPGIRKLLFTREALDQWLSTQGRPCSPVAGPLR